MIVSKPDDIYHGVWWLPGAVRKVHGLLIFEKNGRATFETAESFSRDKPTYRTKTEKHEIVLGVATSINDGKDYSFRLYSMLEIRWSEQVFTKTRFAVSRVLKALPNPDDTSLSFDSLRLTSTFLKHWVKRNGLKMLSLRDEETKFGHKIEYRQPKAITLLNLNGDHVYIFFRANTSFNQEHDFVLIERPYLNFEFEAPRNIKEMVKLKTSLERFFMILWEKAHQFDKFDMRSADGTDFENIAPTQKPTSGWNTKYDFEAFVTESQALIQKWFAMAKEDKLVIDTFFFAFVDYRMAIENRFLNFLFALELFHRKKVRAKQPLSEKNGRMYNLTMKEVKSGEVKSWLQKVLNQEREISLKQRLPDLLNLIDDRKGIDLDTAIVSRCVQTRHYLVHLDEKHVHQRFNGEELAKVNESLATLMLRLLKKELLES